MILNLNAQVFYQWFGHASYHHILQITTFGIYTGLPNYIPKLSHVWRTCILFKGTRVPRHTSLSTENLDPGTIIYLEISFFKKVSWQKITSNLSIVGATTNIFNYTATVAKIYPSYGLIKVDTFLDHQTSCNYVLILKMLLIPLLVMPLQSM